MRWLAIGACLLGLTACSRKTPPTPAVPSPPTEAPPPTPPRVDQGILAELTREAASRPGVHPSVEETLSAFESAGIAIARKQQVLAAPLAARYCAVAASKAGLNLSLCEFDTVEHAKAGRDRSEAQGKALKGRTLLLVERTLLTLIVHGDDAAILAQRDEASKRFRGR